jgi:hypothetical protein
MNRFHCFFILFFIFLSKIIYAQSIYRVSGYVRDTQKEAMPFVNIVINNSTSQGVMSDIEGRFEYISKQIIQSITVSSVGYQTRKITDGLGGNMIIVLQESAFGIGEATVIAGENPADVIIRKVVANRDKNNPETYSDYKCTTYNKLQFSTEPHEDIFLKTHKKALRDTSNRQTKKMLKHFQKTLDFSKNSYIFLMETVAERRFQSPNQVFEQVQLNRVSGLKESSIVALANQIQPFGFYREFLPILGKQFLNPISKNSEKQYFFELKDTLFRGNDTTFVIAFRPKKGKTFDGIQGILHINTKQFAIQNIQAEATESRFINFALDQQYKYEQGFWFPEQLNFELTLPKYPAPELSSRINGYTYISDANVNIGLKQSDFNPEQQLVLTEDATSRDSVRWSIFHAEHPLNEKEKNTYKVVDKFGEKRGSRFFIKFMELSATNKIGLAPYLSLDLTKVFQSNFQAYEGYRWGLGLTTEAAKNLRLPHRVDAGVWAGYGTRDKAFKYGASAKWRINRPSNTNLTINYLRDITEPGSISEFPTDNLFTRSLYAQNIDQQEILKAVLSRRLAKGFDAQVSFQKQTLKPLYQYQYKDGKDYSKGYHFTEVSAYLRMAIGAQSVDFFGNQINKREPFPVIELGYTHGFDGLLGSNFGYDKAIVTVHQQVPIRRIGLLSYRLELGAVSKPLPYNKLFSLAGSGRDTSRRFGLSAFALENTFQTTTDSLWLSDRFANLYLTQYIGNILYRTKYSRPELTLLHNMAWGNLRNPEQHVGLNFKTPLRGYIESGIRLDNLIRFSYFNTFQIGLGGAAFYQWNAAKTANWEKGFVYRLAIKIGL